MTSYIQLDKIKELVLWDYETYKRICVPCNYLPKPNPPYITFLDMIQQLIFSRKETIIILLQAWVLLAYLFIFIW